MKKITTFIACLAACAGAHAFGENEAAKLVQSYAKTVACGLEETKYQAAKVTGAPRADEMGDRYVVFWMGDVGCSGGSATVTPNFSVVEIAGFNTPVVRSDFKGPDTGLVIVTKFAGGNNVINIEGLEYSGNEQTRTPKKKVKYTFKVDADKFVK